MEIKSISQKIFRTSSNNKENQANQTNPFGVSFKGSMINADVFQENKENNSDEKQNKGKMIVCTLVGSINSVSAAMSRRLNSVVSFGMRMKETTTQLWDRATNINMTEFLTSRVPAFTGHSVRRLQERPVDDLKAMLEGQIANIVEAA